MMEKESRLQLGCALFTCLTMFVALCAAGIVFGLGLNLTSFTLARSNPSARSGNPVDRIALIGEDGNVYTVDRNGQAKIAITSDAAMDQSAAVRRAYVFPNWSPDDQQLAFVGVSSLNNGTASLYAAGSKGGKPNEIFTSVDALPFYLYWSPDSKRVAFLAQDSKDAVTLDLANADGTGHDELGSGSPLYFSWAPDSQTLLSHIGGSRRQSSNAFIGLHSLTGKGKPENLSLSPANFLAPAFSPDGKQILSAQVGASTGADELIVTDAHGGSARTIARFGGNISFTWSPDGAHIAYLQMQRSGTNPKTELHVIAADGSGDQVATDDSVLSFFWSPDSKKIAYLTRAAGGQSELQFAARSAQQPFPSMTWKVISLADRKLTSISTFLPTESFASVIPYFDQYAQSIRIWSPDSSAIVYGAQEKDDSESVYVVAADGRTEAQRIASGTIGVWSWQ
jgi:Tol biopolymer transport system component